MRKLTNYQAIIVDMDGTLYYQRPVRMAMLTEMLLHFWRLPEFMIVQKYRRLYEQGLNEQMRLARLPENAPQIIREWMIDRPLKYVRKHRDAELIGLMKQASNAGIAVIVYSDYPVKEKLGAMGFTPDYSYTSDELGTMKPDAAALSDVLSSLSIEPSHCFVIGDRYEKDGKMAENMGADYMILPGARFKRARYCQDRLEL